MKGKKLSLPIQILIGMTVGVLVGIIFQNNPGFTTEYLKPFGTIYINLLRFLVVPIVLLSIISGIISLKDIKRAGSVGIKAFIYYVITTIFAITIGLLVASLFKGFFPLLPSAELSELQYVPNETPKAMQIIVNIFPNNFVAPMLNADMLPVIVIALLFGAGILLAGENGQSIGKFVNDAYAVVMQVMLIVIKFTPIGVMCLMADVVAVNGAHFIGYLAIAIGVAYLGYILHVVIVYCTNLKFLCKKSPLAFFKGLFPAMVCAFTTTSSSVTLPLTMECCNKMGVEPEISSFVLPLGATINMDGGAIYQAVAAIFIASCYGMDLTLSNMITIIATTTLASIGAASVSGASMIMLALVLTTVGIPVEGIAIIAGVDRLFDMGRCVINVTGDAICAMWLTKLEQKKKRKLV